MTARWIYVFFCVLILVGPNTKLCAELSSYPNIWSVISQAEGYALVTRKELNRLPLERYVEVSVITPGHSSGCKEKLSGSHGDQLVELYRHCLRLLDRAKEGATSTRGAYDALYWVMRALSYVHQQEYPTYQGFRKRSKAHIAFWDEYIEKEYGSHEIGNND